MSIGKLSAAAVVALAVGFTGSDLRADTVQPIKVGKNDPGVIASFFYEGASGLTSNLEATIRVALDEVDGNLWKFTVLVDNQSSNDPLKNRITSFAFDVKEVSQVQLSDGGGVWANAGLGDFKANYQNLEVNACVWAGPNCQGGGGGGVEGGGESELKLTITSDADSLLFGNFASRWQSVDVFDQDGKRASSVAFAGSVAPIPLPPVGFMLLGALGALAFAARRRQVEKV